ncbi:hypothetical protein EDB80DRAFT_566912 [Ilyonectria destructans]|nr:hypothetical protein EDB80DRAFT_566912 [Ilyonectria destructans]
MDFSPNSALHKAKEGRPATRSSLACLPCRSRHVKCDGTRPHCSRCVESETQCDYTKSRRGGLDRATLAERRKQLAAADRVSSIANLALPSSRSVLVLAGAQQQDKDQTCLFAGPPGRLFPASLTDRSFNIEHDSLIESYYKTFHKFHPFVLPRTHLARLSQDPSRQPSLKPLVAVIRFIGHLYDSQEWSTTLKDSVDVYFSEAPHTDPFMVQCRLLYSMALFWRGYSADSKREMDAAVRLALHLEMFRREFAINYGCGDAVLTESWRRTWWTLYLVDGYYAGTLGTMKSEFMDVEATADLPCEEHEFESGEIPEPRTLQEFDCREFDLGNSSFSSFAYLIGAVRCIILALSTAPEIAAKEASTQVIQAADAIIDGWLLLLPKGCKQVLAKNGEIDELMFQAHLVIHVSIINLHRPLSDLKFNPVEEVSSCAREPPPDRPIPELVNVHTIRVLRSVEAQIRLLALPARPFNHTPFVTCMVSEGTLALLSACSFLLKGRELAIARDQIRLTVGCLRALGEVWLRTARNLQEIQIIARQVLGLDPKGAGSVSTRSAEAPSLSGGEGQTTSGSEVGALSNDLFSAMGATDSACGWFELDNLDLDLPQCRDE